MDSSLHVLFIPNNEDNYCYYWYFEDIDEGFFVDVWESSKAIDFANALGITPKYVLTTHKHWDHSNGNPDMASNFPDIKVIGGKKDEVQAWTDPVSDKDVIEIGGMKIECMHTPCHTKGHTCYYVTIDAEDISAPVQRSINNKTGCAEVTGFTKAAFTGDTLFIGTVGKFFEGTAKEMSKNVNRLKALPSNTQIFPGHEYTVKSLEYCKTMDTKNDLLDTVIEESKNLILDGYPSVPLSIDVVAKITIFWRCDEQEVQALCKTDNEIDALAVLRKAKDEGKSLGKL